jgi:hypothetical protein
MLVDVVLDLGVQDRDQQPARAVTQHSLQLRLANGRCQLTIFLVDSFWRVRDGHFLVGFASPRLLSQPAIHNFRPFLAAGASRATARTVTDVGVGSSLTFGKNDGRAH